MKIFCLNDKVLTGSIADNEINPLSLKKLLEKVLHDVSSSHFYPSKEFLNVRSSTFLCVGAEVLQCLHLGQMTFLALHFHRLETGSTIGWVSTVLMVNFLVDNYRALHTGKCKKCSLSCALKDKIAK